MADGLLVVRFAELQAAVSHIDAAVNKMQNEIAEVERSAAPLVASWTGTAKEQYDARQKTWQSAAQELATILGQIKAAVQESASDYQQAERNNAARFE